MTKLKKKVSKKDNIVKFPTKLTSVEREVEAIIFAAAEPLEIDTIESKISKKTDVLKILKKLENEYSTRGINLVCISNKWSFRTSQNLSTLMSKEKTVEKKTIKSSCRNVGNYCLPSTCNQSRDRGN